MLYSTPTMSKACCLLSRLFRPPTAQKSTSIISSFHFGTFLTPKETVMHLIRLASIRRLPASFRPFACFVTQRSFATSAKLADESPAISRPPGFNERLSQSKVNLDSDKNSHAAIVESRGSFWLGQDELYLLAKSGTLKLPFAYLRDACMCPSCKDPINKSRSFRTSDIPKDIRPKWVRWDGSDLSIRWTNDIPGSSSDHTSVWSYDFLKKTHRKPS